MTDRHWSDALRISLARLLRQVETLALDLHGQALNDSNAKDFPGGRALNMLGPAAVLQDWEALYEAKEEAEGAEWAKQPRLDPASSQVASEEHPLNVLTFWTRVIREERDQPTSLSPTISRETDYLRKNLDWMTRADEFDDPAWMECFEVERDLRTLVRVMEDVLHTGWRVQRTRVICTHCDAKARLVHLYDTSGVRLDEFRCPECREPYTYAEFVNAYHQNLAAEGAEKLVLVKDAQDVTGVPVQTMRSWIRRLDVASACDIKSKKLMVWWPDVRLLSERRRRLRRERDAS